MLGEDAGIDIANYAAQIPEPSGPAPNIAIVRGTGAVVLGKGEVDPFGNEGSLGSDTTADAISQAIDDRVKAFLDGEILGKEVVFEVR